jgi:hypothetical protein
MPLKIYFCDACNESIPLKDLHSNRITFDAGKIYCANCGGKRPRTGARAAAWFVAGGVVLTVLVALAYVGGRELQAGRDQTDGVARSVTRIETALNHLRADAFTRGECERMIAPLIESADKTRKDFGVVEERLRAAESGLRTEVAASEARTAEELKKVSAKIAELAESVRRGEADAAQIGALKANLDSLTEKVAELAAARRDAPASAPSNATPTEGAPAGKTNGAEDAEFARLSAMLRENDAGRRYEAVNGLANLHVDGAIEALEGALADPESFVRDAAVRALRRHASLKSVPRIIGALRDPDLFVRTSAKAALKQLVGVEPAFDPDAEPARREKGVKDFEAWWAANAEKFLSPK